MNVYTGRYALLKVTLTLLVLSAVATATPVNGSLTLTGDFTVGATFLNFCDPATAPCPAAPGNWNVPGTGTGDLGPPYANDPNGGLITNLNNANAPVGTTLAGNGLLFLTFAPSAALPVPDIEFYLKQLQAGVGGTADCGSAAAPGQTCTPAGSAVTFLNGNGGNSSATITAVGLARRISTNEFDPLQIVFTSQFNTPFQTVLANFASAGSITQGYSVTFTAASAVPEASAMSLVLVGILTFLLFHGFQRSRRKSAC
jgi:hypothetical protein